MLACYRNLGNSLIQSFFQSCCEELELQLKKNFFC